MAAAPPALPHFPAVFQEGDYGTGIPPYTVAELGMLRFRQSILEKDEWQTKVDNPTIVARWVDEAREQNLGDNAVQYMLGELRDLAHGGGGAAAAGAGGDVGTHVVETGVDGVFFARNNGWISGDLHATLLSQLVELEQDARKVGSWHPGSNEQVLDVVHPSMYCLVDGLTCTIIEEHGGEAAAATVAPSSTAAAHLWESILTQAASLKPRDPSVTLAGVLEGRREAAATAAPPTDYRRRMIAQFESPTFQWLPSEFHLSHDGHVAIESYINNLHPVKHTALYTTIGSIFERFVPLFERVLSSAYHPRARRLNPDPYGWHAEYEGDRDDDDAYDNYYRTRQPRPIDVPPFNAEANPRRPDDLITLNGRRLQVIVKIASIELTPDRPNYPGGTWHVEATLRESIVATGIYYVESNNISNSRLAFRAAVCEPDYEQNDNSGVEAMYGLVNEGPLNQPLGSVATSAHTCLAFPNTLQHCVQPFSLDNPALPGSRKILVFFLIDPTQKITSTATVLPQQREWYADASSETPVGKLLASNPAWPMLRDEAVQAMSALMAERANTVIHHNQVAFEREFSLCEH